MTYTERDLPRKITASSGGDTLFAYDAGGTRVKKQGPSETLLTLGGLYERRTVAGHIQHIFYVTGGDEGTVARIVSEDPARSRRFMEPFATSWCLFERRSDV